MTATLEEQDTVQEEPAAPPPPAAEETDPEAPWGRTSSGAPRAKPGPKGPRSRVAGERTRTRSRTRSSSGPRATPPPRVAGRSRPAGAAGPDYGDALRGVIQSIAFPLAMHPATLPDAAALAAHGPNVADALAALAKERPEVAAVLDRLLAVGPYGLVIAATVPLLAQLATNHRLLAPGLGAMLGAMPPEELVRTFVPTAGETAGA